MALFVPLWLLLSLLLPPPPFGAPLVAPRHDFCPAKCECQRGTDERQTQQKRTPLSDHPHQTTTNGDGQQHNWPSAENASAWAQLQKEQGEGDAATMDDDERRGERDEWGETNEEEEEEEEEDEGGHDGDNQQHFKALSVRCARGGINDSEFLSLLQSLPADVYALEVRGTALSPNNFQWNENINRLSRLSRLALTNSAIPALSQSIRLPLLRSLDLSGNNLEHIQLGSFLGMPMLEWLDLSHNRISVLPTGAFIYLKKLSSLSLSYNRLNRELTTGNLLRGPRALRELQLDGNRLSARQLNEMFTEMNTLKRLEMNHCGLDDAEVWALNLSSVPRLERIGLAGNNLSEVPSSSLRSLALLGTVDLSQNLIRSLGPCAFCGSNISRVFLAHNLFGIGGGDSLRPIHREAFADTRLLELDLSHNQLNGLRFGSEMLHGAQQTLEVLHLSGNGQVTLDARLINTLPRLKALHVADSALRIVPSELPKAYARLTLLNLSGNGLDHLPSNFGTMLPQLQVLDLSRNLFSSFPHALITFIDRLSWVFLHHCPWDCKCAAQPLQLHMLRRLNHKEMLRYDETLCAEPPMLRGQPLHRVQKINDCAILFGANYGITQNTELLLILGALLLAALFLSAILALLLYCGRESKQKGTYVTGEGLMGEGAKKGEMRAMKDDGRKNGTTTSKRMTMISTGGERRAMLDLDTMAVNGHDADDGRDYRRHNSANIQSPPLIRNGFGQTMQQTKGKQPIGRTTATNQPPPLAALTVHDLHPFPSSSSSSAVWCPPPSASLSMDRLREPLLPLSVSSNSNMNTNNNHSSSNTLLLAATESPTWAVAQQAPLVVHGTIRRPLHSGAHKPSRIDNHHHAISLGERHRGGGTVGSSGKGIETAKTLITF